MPTSPALLGLDQPPVLPQHVGRVTADGRPTRYLLDWEQFTYQFQSSALLSLDSRISTVESNYEAADVTIAASVTSEQIARANADGALAANILTVQANYISADAVISASVTSEQVARVAADGALAADITLLEASYNDISASGEIYFAAKAGPTGSSAAYGLYLTAGAAFAGFEVVALSAGGSAINMTAEKLLFSDSGTATPVFDYGVSTPGVFTFNVPVEINNVDIGANAVSNTVVATGSVVNATSLDTPGLTVRDGARVVVEVKVTDTTLSAYVSSFGAGYALRSFLVRYNGPFGNVVMGNMYSMDSVISATFLGGSAYQFQKAISPSSEVFVLTGLDAGSYGFQVINNSGYTLGFSITATELSR